MAWVSEGSLGVVESTVVPVAGSAAFAEVALALGFGGGLLVSGTLVVTAKANEMDRWLGLAVDGFGVSLHTVVEIVHGDGTRMVIAMTGVAVVMTTAKVLIAGRVVRDESVAISVATSCG